MLAMQSGNVLSFCNETLKLNGSSAISKVASIVFGNLTLTAVAAASTPQHSVAFLGTDTGRLKKVFLTNQGRAEEFEEVVIDSGKSILADMEVDTTGHYVYVASPYKVSRIRVDRCQQYNTCDQCLQARNPYCGWCSLEKRCTVQSECLNASAGGDQRSSSRWLSLDTQQCIDFQSIAPEKLPRTAMATVEIAINQLPQLPRGAHYECVFGRSAPIQARATQHGLACSTPAVHNRPSIPAGADHVDVTLYIRSSETNTDFLHRPFTFYDCSVHKTCSACVTSAFACNWCFSENSCTHNASACSRNVIRGENNPQNSLVKGRQHCPSFSADSSILLANGVRTEVAVEARNLPNPAGPVTSCEMRRSVLVERQSRRAEEKEQQAAAKRRRAHDVFEHAPYPDELCLATAKCRRTERPARQTGEARTARRSREGVSNTAGT
ncbi:plexin-B [Ixodes scapularis]